MNLSNKIKIVIFTGMLIKGLDILQSQFPKQEYMLKHTSITQGKTYNSIRSLEDSTKTNYNY